MLTRRVRLQLVVFAIVSVVAVTIASVDFLGIWQLFGSGQFQVKADFGDVSGLYPSANVTYRGVDVGKVHALDVSRNGVEVVLRINDGAKISKDAVAQVHSTSAIGEQYVDLVPSTNGGPYLQDGSIIARSSTVEMPQAAPLLDKLDGLLQSVPKPQLSAVLDEADTAFAGTGPALNNLVRSTSELLTTAQENLAPTVNLITALDPFLRQQQRLEQDNATSVANLDTFTRALVASDPGLRTLIRIGPGLASNVDNLVAGVRPNLSTLLNNLSSVGQVIVPQIAGLKELLSLVPITVGALEKAEINPGNVSNSIALDLKLNVANPAPCTTGFLPKNQQRPPTTTTLTRTGAGLYCRSTASDAPRGASIRGNRNLECLSGEAGHARAATYEQCLGEPIKQYPTQVSASSGTNQAHAATTESPMVQILVSGTTPRAHTLGELLFPSGP